MIMKQYIEGNDAKMVSLALGWEGLKKDKIHLPTLLDCVSKSSNKSGTPLNLHIAYYVDEAGTPQWKIGYGQKFNYEVHAEELADALALAILAKRERKDYYFQHIEGQEKTAECEAVKDEEINTPTESLNAFQRLLKALKINN